MSPLSRLRFPSRLVVLGTLAITVAACAALRTADNTGDAAPERYSPAADASIYDAPRAGRKAIFLNAPGEFAGQITLHDGRKVRMWIATSGTRLMEQHYSPVHDAWTTPVVRYASKEPHPCQRIELAEEDGVVAAIANFGMWCYDGEEMAMNSVALVATGDLTNWDDYATTGVHRWSEVKVSGGTITWTDTWTDERPQLTWTADHGFHLDD